MHKGMLEAYNRAKTKFETLNWTLLTELDAYENNRQALHVKCIEGHVFSRRPDKLNPCRECKGAKPKDLGTQKKIAHQHLIRIATEKEDRKLHGSEVFDADIGEYTFHQEPYQAEHKEFIIRYEWLGGIGTQPLYVFTARLNGILSGIVMVGRPTAYSKLLGDKTMDIEALIQRGANASWAHKHLSSKLIRFACKWVVKNTTKKVFVAYSDPYAGEIGTVYQAAGFEYLGAEFGVKFMYKHHSFKNGKPFSSQSLRRTSVLRKWLKDNGIEIKPEWFKANGFKDLSTIPNDIKERWYTWGKELLKECVKLKADAKGKYVLVLGNDKREQYRLNEMKTYKVVEYIKR